MRIAEFLDDFFFIAKKINEATTKRIDIILKNILIIWRKIQIFTDKKIKILQKNVLIYWASFLVYVKETNKLATKKIKIIWENILNHGKTNFNRKSPLSGTVRRWSSVSKLHTHCDLNSWNTSEEFNRETFVCILFMGFLAVMQLYVTYFK